MSDTLLSIKLPTLNIGILEYLSHKQTSSVFDFKLMEIKTESKWTQFNKQTMFQFPTILIRLIFMIRLTYRIMTRREYFFAKLSSSYICRYIYIAFCQFWYIFARLIPRQIINGLVFYWKNKVMERERNHNYPYMAN